MDRSIFKITNEKAFFILLCFIWGYQCVFRIAIAYLNRFQSLGNIIAIAIFVALILFSLSYIKNAIRVSDVFFGIAVLLVSLITVLIDAKSTDAFVELCFPFLTQYFIMYYVGLSICSLISYNSSYFKYFEYISIASIFIITIIYRNSGENLVADWDSVQYMAYWILPHLLLLLATLFKRFSILELITVLYGSANLFLYGNRGAVVCLLVMLLLMCIIKLKNIKSSKKYLVLGFILIGIFIVWFTDIYETAMLGMYQYALSHNMSTRVFQTFLGTYSNDAGFDSGRYELQKQLLENLLKNPLGYGLAGDRYLRGEGYAHNIFLEILIDFGFLIGGLLCVAILAVLVKAAKCIHEKKDHQIVFLTLFCCGFIKLLISGSFLSDPYFFALIGFAVALIREENDIRLNIEGESV